MSPQDVELIGLPSGFTADDVFELCGGIIPHENISHCVCRNKCVICRVTPVRDIDSIVLVNSLDGLKVGDYIITAKIIPNEVRSICSYSRDPGALHAFSVLLDGLNISRRSILLTTLFILEHPQDIPAFMYVISTKIALTTSNLSKFDPMCPLAILFLLFEIISNPLLHKSGSNEVLSDINFVKKNENDNSLKSSKLSDHNSTVISYSVSVYVFSLIPHALLAAGIACYCLRVLLSLKVAEGRLFSGINVFLNALKKHQSQEQMESSIFLVEVGRKYGEDFISAMSSGNYKILGSWVSGRGEELEILTESIAKSDVVTECKLKGLPQPQPKRLHLQESYAPSDFGTFSGHLSTFDHENQEEQEQRKTMARFLAFYAIWKDEKKGIKNKNKELETRVQTNENTLTSAASENIVVEIRNKESTFLMGLLSAATPNSNLESRNNIKPMKIEQEHIRVIEDFAFPVELVKNEASTHEFDTDSFLNSLDDEASETGNKRLPEKEINFEIENDVLKLKQELINRGLPPLSVELKCDSRRIHLLNKRKKTSE